MAETCTARRAKLSQISRLINQLVDINETAYRTNLQLKSAGISVAEIENTLNGILNGAGPPKKGASVSLDECTADTVTDRIINLLNINVAEGVDWIADAE